MDILQVTLYSFSMPPWIESYLTHSQLIYPTVFLLLLLAGLGIPVSADLVLLTCGYLLFTQKVSGTILIPLAMMAILISDTIMFNIGKKFGMKLTSLWPFKKILTQERIEKAQKSFSIHGYTIVFWARFMPGIRTVFMFTSGLLKLRYPKFILYDFLGTLIVVPVTVLSVTWVAGNTAVIADLMGQIKWLVLIVFIVLVVFKLASRRKVMIKK